MTVPNRKPVIKVQSFDDLSKVLLLQRIITRQANEKLHAIVGTMQAPDGSDSEEYSYFAEVMDEQAQLLNSYLTLPTLTEFTEQPALHGQFIWGATFGVTLLMSEIILHHIHSPSLKLARINRFLLVRLLQEVSDSYSDEESMFSRVITTANIQIPNISSREKHEEAVAAIVTPILEGMLLLLVEYGIIDSKGGHYYLTDPGTRALLHLVDAQRFIDDVTTAHTRFQRERKVNKLAEESLACVD